MCPLQPDAHPNPLPDSIVHTIPHANGDAVGYPELQPDANSHPNADSTDRHANSYPDFVPHGDVDAESNAHAHRDLDGIPLILTNSYFHPYPNQDRQRNSNPHRDAYGDVHANANRLAVANLDPKFAPHRYPNAQSHRDANAYPEPDADGNGIANADANVTSDPVANPDGDNDRVFDGNSVSDPNRNRFRVD